MSEADLRPQADPQFRADVLDGLRGPRRAIPARWFYDKHGSHLFDEITRLPEYYPTRIETELLAKHRDELAKLVPAGSAVVEFGAGSATKTPLLLEAIDPDVYIPVDISGEYLRASAQALARQFPDLAICPIEADFSTDMRLPTTKPSEERLGFFPGSTIGNFVPRSSVDLLRHMRNHLGQGARLLIGFDRIKPTDILLPAYRDAAGVTAAFNLNLLTRINRELDGTIPVDAFVHHVEWNDREARIEMHLRCIRDVQFRVLAHNFEMRAGESIHTENSHKFDLRSLRILLRAGGWTPVAEFSDAAQWFTLVLAEAAPRHDAP